MINDILKGVSEIRLDTDKNFELSLSYDGKKKFFSEILFQRFADPTIKEMFFCGYPVKINHEQKELWKLVEQTN